MFLSPRRRAGAPMHPLFLLAAVASVPAAAQQAEADAHPEQDTVELETVVVTANPLGRTADELVQPTTVLHGETLRRLRAPTIGQTLQSIPGIAASSFGAGASRPVIRGQAGARVQVLENGLGALDVSDVSPDHAVSVSPAQATQIEVIKGPAALLYGSGASGGVVNVRNSRLPTEVVEGFHGVAEAGYADNASERFGLADANLALGAQGQLHFDYGWTEAGDYEVPGPVNADGSGPSDRQPNSDARTRNGALSYGHLFGDSLLAASVSRLLSDYGLPNEETAFIEMDQTRYDLLGLLDRPWRGVESVRLRAAYNDYAHTEFEGPGEPGTRYFNEQHQERVELTHGGFAGWRGTAGLAYDDRDFEAVGEEAFVPSTQTRQAGLFLIEERPLSWGRLELGGRFDRVRLSPDRGDRRRFSLTNLSAGLVFDLTADSHLKLYAAQAQRAPSAEELYAFGAHIATAAFERGLPGADVETGRNAEIGFDHHGGRWNLDASLWYEDFSDYTYLSAVDEGLDAGGSGPGVSDGVADRVDEAGELHPAGDFTLYSVRQSDAEFWGYELEGAYAVRRSGPLRLTLRAFTDAVRGKLDGGENLPRITPRRYGLGAHGGYGVWHASLDYTYVDDTEHLAPLETPTDSYGMLDADLSRHFRLWPDALGESEVYLRARNLLDEEARVATSFIKDEVLMPGRSLMLGIRLAI